MSYKLKIPFYIGDINTIATDSKGKLSEIEILDSHGELVFYIQSYVQTRAKTFIDCINVHDKLIEKVEILKKDMKKLKYTLEDAYKYKKKYYEIKSCRKLYEDEKRKNEKLQEALKECYDIAYDLMPTGAVDTRIFDLSCKLREISKFI